MPKPESPCHGTQIETDEDVAAALLAAASRGAAPRPHAPAASAWRPTARAPVALLTVCDDGRADGEVVRLRGDRFVIGRTEGHLTLPHDPLVSTRHAEVTRQQHGGTWRWVVTDLQSTNGLFVRLSRAGLSDRSELLVGRGRYRFDAPDEGGTLDHVPGAPAPPGGSTHGWAEAAPGPGLALRPPALTELVPGGIGNRIVLTRPEYWVGSDPACDVCRPDDPFCEPRHARVFFSPRGGWQADHPKTANGLWVRMPQMVVEKGALQFQVGEQRFRLRV